MVQQARAPFGTDLIEEMERQSRVYDDDANLVTERQAMLQLGRELLKELGRNADTMSDEQVLVALRSELDLDPIDMAHNHEFGEQTDADFDENCEFHRGTRQLLHVV